MTTTVIPLATARARRAAATTNPAPVSTPALPAWRTVIATAPEEALNRWARRLLWAVGIGFAAIAAAVFLGLYLWPR